MKSKNWISTTGFMPRVAMPIARPMMFASASGELKTRSFPNCFWRPCVTLNTPPLPLTSLSAASRVASATSSPKTTTRGSRAISSFMQRLISVTMVSGPPSNLGSVSNAFDVGSTVGE